MNSLVRDMMTTEVVTVEPSTPFKEIVARLAGQRVSAVPVVDADWCRWCCARCRASRAWSGSRTGSSTTSTTAAATCC